MFFAMLMAGRPSFLSMDGKRSDPAYSTKILRDCDISREELLGLL